MTRTDMNLQLNAIIRHKQRAKNASVQTGVNRNVYIGRKQAVAPAVWEQTRIYLALARSMSRQENPVVLKRFVVNEHLDVCLVSISFTEVMMRLNAKLDVQPEKKTMVYIDGKPFRQCMYLILREVDVYTGAKTMDEIIDATPKENKIDEGFGFLPEEEAFVGHCSNVQAWAENDYDPALMDTRLSIPILGELARAGDDKAKRVLRGYFEDKLLGEHEKVAVAFFESKHGEIEKVKGLVERFEQHASEKGWKLALSSIHRMNTRCDGNTWETSFIGIFYTDAPRSVTLDPHDFDVTLWGSE